MTDLEREEWIVVRWTAEPNDWVRAADRLVPDQVGVTIRQQNVTRSGTGRPDAELRFEMRPGVGIGCADFRIVSKPGDRMIRSSDLALIDLDRLALDAFEHFAQPIDEPEPAPADELSRSALDRVMRDTKMGRVRERQDVARIYLDAALDGRPPAEAVRREMGYGSIETANRRIRDARDRGLIPPVGASEEDQRAALAKLERGHDNGEAQ